jgi:sugar lactone lactonase YvrE
MTLSLTRLATFCSVMRHTDMYAIADETDHQRDNISANPPDMGYGVWSFNPRKGHLKMIDDSVPWPNGVALSWASNTLYVTCMPPSINTDRVPAQ